MQQPKSIERFEQFYFARIAIGLIVTIMTWSNTVEVFHQSPLAERMGDGVLFVGPVISLAIALALWFFIARRGSLAAKWIFVVLYALSLFGLISLVMPLPEGMAQIGMATRIGQLLSLALGAVCCWYLFRPDTRAWFNGGVDPAA